MAGRCTAWCRDGTARHLMQAGFRFWQRLKNRAARQAWGMASDGDGWALVGLTLERAVGVRVLAMERIETAASGPSAGNFSEGLRPLAAQSVRAGQRLNVALDANDTVAGMLELPAHLRPQDWAAEVQTEVSQLLGLGPDEVSFDFQRDPLTEGLLSRVHWVGCDLGLIQKLQAHARAAGWQLHSVEPAWHAAHRAACHLRGGLSSLLTQSPQDWQFDLSPNAPDTLPLLPVQQEFGPGLALRQAMHSSAGPRLVASGLALKAWLG
ncbi:hypothetical protein [Limnohabitans sp.]|uniref:hypothetical protein n=1 Tax=Limnohabitans sp. TaxID=1907725 RepID=UPI0037BE8F87